MDVNNLVAVTRATESGDFERPPTEGQPLTAINVREPETNGSVETVMCESSGVPLNEMMETKTAMDGTMTNKASPQPLGRALAEAMESTNNDWEDGQINEDSPTNLRPILDYVPLSPGYSPSTPKSESPGTSPWYFSRDHTTSSVRSHMYYNTDPEDDQRHLAESSVMNEETLAIGFRQESGPEQSPSSTWSTDTRAGSDSLALIQPGPSGVKRSRKVLKNMSALEIAIILERESAQMPTCGPPSVYYTRVRDFAQFLINAGFTLAEKARAIQRKKDDLKAGRREIAKLQKSLSRARKARENMMELASGVADANIVTMRYVLRQMREIE